MHSPSICASHVQPLTATPLPSSDRSAEFAVYLFLISLFPTTLLPSSLYGFFTTGCALVFSGPVGGLVDTRRRLRVVRATIAVQKVSVAIAYSALLVLFLHLRSQAAEAGSDIGSGSFPLVWFLFSVIVAAGSALKLGTVCLSVAIERDWVTTISAGSGARLTRLNVILRRIDLGSKLLCPLFVSLLTSTAGDVAAVSTLFGIAGAGMVFELVWINVVWRTWPILAEEENARRLRNGIDTDASAPVGSLTLFQRTSNLVKALPSGLRQIVDDWRSFIHVSIFPTSLAVSLLYFTVLSFDGTMISWLKTSTYSDGLIAGMRGLAVLMGLMGTVLAPWLEKRVGLVRAAGWSIWSVLRRVRSSRSSSRLQVRSRVPRARPALILHRQSGLPQVLSLEPGAPLFRHGRLPCRTLVFRPLPAEAAPSRPAGPSAAQRFERLAVFVAKLGRFAEIRLNDRVKVRPANFDPGSKSSPSPVSQSSDTVPVRCCSQCRPPSFLSASLPS